MATVGVKGLINSDRITQECKQPDLQVPQQSLEAAPHGQMMNFMGRLQSTSLGE